MGLNRLTVNSGGYFDQVRRKERFLRHNPSVMLLSPRVTGLTEWTASWDEENGSSVITRLELRDILDVLEDRFGVPGRPDDAEADDDDRE